MSSLMLNWPCRRIIASGTTTTFLRFCLTRNTTSLRCLSTEKIAKKPEAPIPVVSGKEEKDNKTKDPTKVSSSKVEDTVQRLKERQRQKLEELSLMQDLEREVKFVIDEDTKTAKTVLVKEPKKSLWIRFVDEVKHYYHGFKLLYFDVKVSSKIIWKVLHGGTLSRRENKQLVRTVSDLFRLVPFSVFVLVPFMELLLPVALKLFPGMLPSTFTTSSERDNKMRRALKAKLEYAKFLQKTLDEMSPQTNKDRSSQSAKDFVDFYTKVKSGEVEIKNKEILKFSKLFEDEITLDNMRRGQLVAICRLLELTPFGNSNFLRFQIEMKLRHLKNDDLVIQKEGIGNLSVQELQNACRERGMRAIGLTEELLKTQMSQWLALSLDAKVPPSLLLLSRTLYFPSTLDTPGQIAATISTLPESAATQTKATIGEREGKIENITRLEVIQEEQRKIEEEALEEKEVAESLPPKEEIISVEPPPVIPVIEPKPEIPEKITLDQPEVEVKTKDKLSIDDLSDLKQAIATLGTTTTTSEEVLSDEIEEITDLKKELLEYEEDVQMLKEVKVEAERTDLEESKAAKRLFNKLQIMVNKADFVVEKIHQKEKEYGGHISNQEQSEKIIGEDNFVSVQDLISSVLAVQKTLDSSKLDQITEILSQVDVDSDGVINVDHVLKVISLLDKKNLNLSGNQIRKIVDMLEKEEALEIENKIENIFISSFEKQQEDLLSSTEEDAQLKSSEDIAKDLTENVPESHIKEMFKKNSK